MYFIILAFSPEVRNRIQGKTSWLFISQHWVKNRLIRKTVERFRTTHRIRK